MLSAVEHDAAPNGRLIAKVLRDVLARETFTQLADLVEGLKVECARLRISWSNDDIGEALRVVGSNHPLVQPAAPLPVAHVAEPREFSRAEAATVLGNVMAYFGPRAFKTLGPRVRSRITIDGPVRDVVDVESLVGGR